MNSPRTSEAERAFVVRQPIFDRVRRTIAYELLHLTARSPQPAEDQDTVETRDAASVLTDAVLAIGLETLAGDKPAFVSVTRDMLLEGLPDTLPASRLVLQLPATVVADTPLLDSIRSLRHAGFRLAIDAYAPAALMPHATHVRIDASDLLGGRAPSRPTTVALVATHVDTMAMFDALSTRPGGPTAFEGFCLGQPVITQGRRVPASHLTYVRLLRSLNNPNLSLQELEELIKHDASLCHRILRTVNSAGFALHRTIESIREGLLLLGRDTIRRWASLWILAGLGGPQSELVAMATIRGRCCEILGATLPGDDGGVEGFLLGLCSLLDAILGQPMGDVLRDLPLDAVTASALLGADNVKGRLLRCAVAYERGRWDEAFALARQLGLDPVRLPAAYAEALRWHRSIESARAA